MNERRRNNRRALILAAAAELAEETGFIGLTRADAAEAAGVSKASISFHFGSAEGLRCEVMQYAVDNGLLRVVLQGLAVGNTIAEKAPLEMRRRARDLLAV
jgi:AcrR family transcriptional regulator